ncbi:hypothetical protein Tco_1475843 [Tanacetum coccineum]
MVSNLDSRSSIIPSLDKTYFINPSLVSTADGVKENSFVSLSEHQPPNVNFSIASTYNLEQKRQFLGELDFETPVIFIVHTPFKVFRDHPKSNSSIPGCPRIYGSPTIHTDGGFLETSSLHLNGHSNEVFGATLREIQDHLWLGFNWWIMSHKILSAVTTRWEIVIGIYDFLCLLEWTGVEVQEEPHHDIRPNFQRLPFYCTLAAAVDVVVPDPTPEELAVRNPSVKVIDKVEASQKRKASTFSFASGHVAKRARSAVAQSSGSTTHPNLFVDDSGVESDDDDE